MYILKTHQIFCSHFISNLVASYVYTHVCSIYIDNSGLSENESSAFRKQFTACTHLSGHIETWTCQFLSNVWVIEQGSNNNNCTMLLLDPFLPLALAYL